ncbi:MAG TPA: ATP-binding domain-containing protein [Polyangiaceae bacterium]|nr:ATP-binding domain-containing protein [Polyangiaceae bacterium]
MSSRPSDLTPEEQAVLEEEESLLARARVALEAERAKAARSGGSELRSVAALRELRDEAAVASADDLPPLLLEMSIRQRLIERGGKEAIPDAASPYLAHLRVREGADVKDYLLGRASFLDPASGVRIVDWRVAPVAQIFYRHREGDPYEETFPGRVAEGVVEARRIVVIANGVLTRVIGDNLALTRSPDGRWSRADRGALAFVSGGAGSAARPGSLGVGAGAVKGGADVTALLDAEQFAAVSAPAEDPLLVLGSAGSGKTTVALHRLARIAAREPERYPLSRVGVVVPEEGLARLSRRLLEPLGVGEAQVKTLDSWALDLAHTVLGSPLPRLYGEPPAVVSSLKRHPALYDALRARFQHLPPSTNVSLKRLRRRLAEALTDRSFLEKVVTSGPGLSRVAIDETIRHTMLQLSDHVDKELASIVVPEMKQALDNRAIDEGTPGEIAGSLDVEDLPILLFMRAAVAGLSAPRTAHLVLDEAEDFALFELDVLGKLLGTPRSVTLAGDEAQQTSSSFAGWPRSLETLGASSAATLRLATSYRCPRPVAELARRVLGHLAPVVEARISREGAPVGWFGFPTEQQADLFLAGAVRDLVDREPHASLAVLTRDADAARRFYELVREIPEARLVENGEFTFDAGVDVTGVEDAKGLEFDYVIIPDATVGAYPTTDDGRRRLHVAITRASHQLWIASGGVPSRLLPELAASPAP